MPSTKSSRLAPPHVADPATSAECVHDPARPIVRPPPAPPDARPEPRLIRYYRDLVSFPNDARAAWRREGPIGAWLELRHRTICRIYQSWHHLLVESSLEGDHPPVSSPPGIEIRPLTDDAWPLVLELADSRGRTKLQEMRARGQLCFLASRGARVVGYIWVATPGTAAGLLPGAEMPDTGVFLHLLYVCRSERGKGIASSLHLAAGHHAKALGYKFVWAAAELPNRRAILSIARTMKGGVALTRVGTMQLSVCLGRPNMKVVPDPAYDGPLAQCFP